MARITDPQTRQATRARFLRAAAREFAQVGFEEANISTIAEQAGLGKGTIYLYFESKRDLFLALLQSIAQRQLAVARTALEQQGRLEQQLEALFLAFVQLAIEDAEEFHVFMSALYGVNRAFQHEAVLLLREFVRLLGGVLARATPHRPLTPAEQEARALWVFSATESLVLAARALGYSERQLMGLAPTITALLVNGLRGSSPAR
jgi:AcrR family transcriptional regulator